MWLMVQVLAPLKMPDTSCHGKFWRDVNNNIRMLIHMEVGMHSYAKLFRR